MTDTDESLRSSHHVSTACRHCGHREVRTVDTHIEGRGHMETLAIRECQKCGQLWADKRDFMGVYDGE